MEEEGRGGARFSLSLFPRYFALKRGKERREGRIQKM